MNEPAVTLTDYGLALECAVLVVLLVQQAGGDVALRRWFQLLFGSLGLAALAGGTVHGFVTDMASLPGRLLWALTLLAIGLTALATWATGAHLLDSLRAEQTIVSAAIMSFVGYAAIALLVIQAFWVAMAYYLPAAMFLLVMLTRAYVRFPDRALVMGIIGLLLTIVAAGIQRAGIPLYPVYFNYNALYHALQAVAVILVFLTARRLANRDER